MRGPIAWRTTSARWASVPTRGWRSAWSAGWSWWWRCWPRSRPAAWAHHPLTDPRPAGLTADNLCYVIYTSGSTGLPKGVAVPHRGVLNLVGWHQRAYGVTPADRATQFASPAFDAAAWETW